MGTIFASKIIVLKHLEDASFPVSFHKDHWWSLWNLILIIFTTLIPFTPILTIRLNKMETCFISLKNMPSELWSYDSFTCVQLKGAILCGEIERSKKTHLFSIFQIQIPPQTYIGKHMFGSLLKRFFKPFAYIRFIWRTWAHKIFNLPF